MADIMALDMESFKTRRRGSGRPTIVLSEDLLGKIRTLVTANNGMQSSQFFTSTSAEADAYNAERTKAFEIRAAKLAAENKEAGDAPAAITKTGNAERLAKIDAQRFAPYVNAVAEELDKGVSLRTRNEGNEDNPSVRWGFVLVNHRAPKGSATAS
jgi:hypothetical protein